VLGDSEKKNIRFDENVYSLLALHHHITSSTMAMLILFVVSTFFVHINRMLNAGFFVQKKLQ